MEYVEIMKLVKEIDDPVQIRGILKYIFTKEENLINGNFAYFFFPHVIKAKSPKFHQEIYEFLLDPNSMAIAAPRGFAKSTIAGLFFLTWCIVNKKKKYIVYMSQSHEKTIQFIEPLRNEFKENNRLKLVYGDLTPKGVKDDDGKDRQDLIDIGGVRIQAVSFNKNIRGFKYKSQRPDAIVLDDIDDDERLLNPESRRKDFFKLTKQVIPSLSNDEGSAIKMIGTILHWDSLLVNRIQTWGGKVYQACKVDENGNIIPSTSLWQDYWNKAKLDKIKADIGSISFNSEYLNNPIDDDTNLIKRKWIQQCCDVGLSYEDAEERLYQEKHLGVDFAFSDRVVADKSAYVGLGCNLDDAHTLFYLRTKQGLSTTEQFNLLKDINDKYKFDWVVMEENSIRSMSKELINYNFNHYLIWTGNYDTADSLKPSIEFENRRHSVSKKNMIIRLATQFENRNIRLPYKTDEDQRKTNQLIDELMTFALQDGKLIEVGIHADIPIALAMAIEKIAQNQEVIIN